MSEPRWQDEVGPFVTTMQVITSALMLGVTIFGVVALSVSFGQGDDPPILVYLAIGFAAAVIVARAIVPGIVAAAGRKKIAEGKWPTGDHSAMPAEHREFFEKHGNVGALMGLINMIVIINGAILEAAFLCLLAYMLTREPICLGMAIVLVLGIAMGFPTRSRVIHWVEDQLNALEQQRLFED